MKNSAVRSWKTGRKKARSIFQDRLSLKDVSYSYPESSEQALQHISLTIPRGKAVAFVGPSGAGKLLLWIYFSVCWNRIG
jgi:ABC-type multidrug transport system fused ATPase/permease subunit